MSFVEEKNQYHMYVHVTVICWQLYVLQRAHEIENSKLFLDFDHRHRSAFWIKAELKYRHCHQIDKIRNKLM